MLAGLRVLSRELRDLLILPDCPRRAKEHGHEKGHEGEPNEGQGYESNESHEGRSDCILKIEFVFGFMLSRPHLENLSGCCARAVCKIHGPCVRCPYRNAVPK